MLVQRILKKFLNTRAAHLVQFLNARAAHLVYCSFLRPHSWNNFVMIAYWISTTPRGTRRMLVKSYGKLRNWFGKSVAVSVDVFSNILWKNTKLLFESLLLFLLLFLVKSYGKLRNCFLKVCFGCCSEAASQYSRSASVLRQFLDAGAAYFKEVFECSRSASGLMQFLNPRAAHLV